MRHAVDHRKLRRPTSHRLAMLRNLTISLLLHESLRISVAKAKEVRRMAEKAITWGKRGDLHARRLAFSALRSKEATHKVFQDLAQRYAARPGGYTRILRLGSRQGDHSPVALIELVDRKVAAPRKEKKAKDDKAA